ncbi:MAG: pyridoxal phosphate-dependent aminotransferase family protein [Desulfobacterium sp.]|jgi:8-amino-7-oxononanoate synthase|nr:pyridoxal phosphate-dependent aminotransferase family protein [Desulfobacterium sp.]
MLAQLTHVAIQKLRAKGKEYYGTSPDVFSKMYAFTRANTLRALGYYPYYPKIEKANATEVTVDGKQKIMLGSNNYLGLTNHPKVIEAGVKALREYGSGLTGSRLLNGNTLLHDQLEERLADFVDKESALVFSTGFGTNLGTIATVCGPDTIIFSDEYNHASIVDGIRFSGAQKCIYKHNDMKDLEGKLAAADTRYPKFIVTDGIFSMEGDIARLDELAALSKRYSSRLMVDDAHSLGVLGPNGDGTAAHFGVTGEVDLIMGTFSKSLGCIGGFISGETMIIDYLKHNSRAMLFTASLPPSNAASVMAALDIIQAEPERRERLIENTEFVRNGLKASGFNLGESTTPIIPVIIGKDIKTFQVWKGLMNAGVYTNPIISPGVPQGRGLLRTSYMATHTHDQLEFCLDIFEKVGRKAGIIN